MDWLDWLLAKPANIMVLLIGLLTATTIICAVVILEVPLVKRLIVASLIKSLLKKALSDMTKAWGKIRSTLWKRMRKAPAPKPVEPRVTDEQEAGSSQDRDNQKTERPRMPLPLIIIMLVGLVGLGIAVYGIYSLWYPSEAVTLEAVLAVLGGVLTLAFVAAASVNYRLRHGAIRWNFWRKAPTATPTGTPAATGQAASPLNPQPRQSWIKWVAWPVAALVVLVIGLSLYRYATAPPPDTGVLIGRAWTPVIRFLPGQQVILERRENADYEMKIPVAGGWKVYTISRDPIGDTRLPCERHVRILEHFTSFQLRVIDKEKEAVVFDIVFSPYTLGGPCGPQA